jgi:hypothetical protein
MKKVLSLPLLVAAAVLSLSSCADKPVSTSSLSPMEKGLLNALNAHRAGMGKTQLEPTESLTTLARADAARRAGTGDGYQKNRDRTGYERMLTLAGKAAPGETFGYTLLGYWLDNPVQKKWLEGSYANVGVGTATGKEGLENGVLLLGGF